MESTIKGDKGIRRRRYSYSSRRIAHLGLFWRSIWVPQSTNNIKTQKKTSKLSISGRNTESSKLRGGYEYSLPSFCGANSFLYTRTLFANRSLHSFLPNHHHPTTHNMHLCSIPPHFYTFYTTTTTTTSLLYNAHPTTSNCAWYRVGYGVGGFTWLLGADLGVDPDCLGVPEVSSLLWVFSGPRRPHDASRVNV